MAQPKAPPTMADDDLTHLVNSLINKISMPPDVQPVVGDTKFLRDLFKKSISEGTTSPTIENNFGRMLNPTINAVADTLSAAGIKQPDKKPSMISGLFKKFTTTTVDNDVLDDDALNAKVDEMVPPSELERIQSVREQNYKNKIADEKKQGPKIDIASLSDEQKNQVIELAKLAEHSALTKSGYLTPGNTNVNLDIVKPLIMEKLGPLYPVAKAISGERKRLKTTTAVAGETGEDVGTGTKVIDAQTAQKFYNLAKGDKDLARQLATQAGFKF